MKAFMSDPQRQERIGHPVDAYSEAVAIHRAVMDPLQRAGFVEGPIESLRGRHEAVLLNAAEAIADCLGDEWGCAVCGGDHPSDGCPEAHVDPDHDDTPCRVVSPGPWAPDGKGGWVRVKPFRLLA